MHSHWPGSAVRGHRPEFVLLDIGLAGMDGYEVAGKLRRQPGMDTAVLIAVTAYGQDEDRGRARAAGFDHHLTKAGRLRHACVADRSDGLMTTKGYRPPPYPAPVLVVDL
jgi:response regulator RpfG family c-di-GMP phosphodiesterase